MNSFSLAQFWRTVWLLRWRGNSEGVHSKEGLIYPTDIWKLGHVDFKPVTNRYTKPVKQ